MQITVKKHPVHT